MKRILSLISLFLCLSAQELYADSFDEPFKEYYPKVLEQYKSFQKDNLNSMAYDAVTGTVSFKEVDIDIPGNFDLPVRLGRWIPKDDLRIDGPADWKWDVPYIKGHYSDALQYSDRNHGWGNGKNCTSDVTTTKYTSSSGQSIYILADGYWGGKELHIPDRVDDTFLIGGNISTPYYEIQATTSNYIISDCIDGDEEGIVVTAPNGDKYSFDKIISYENYSINSSFPRVHTKILLATKVEDKFGNWVRYNYSNDNKLTSITSSDSRTITVNHNSTTGEIVTASVNGKVWTYEDNRPTDFKVILPDNRYWKYDALTDAAGWQRPTLFNGQENGMAARRTNFVEKRTNNVANEEFTPGYCGIQNGYESLKRTKTIKDPDGVITTFELKPTYHGRSDVKPSSKTVNVNFVNSNTGYRTASAPASFSCFVFWSMTSKSISGPGMETQLWNYQYSENEGGYYNEELNSTSTEPTLLHSLPDSIDDSKNLRTTTISGPNFKQVNYINRQFGSVAEGSIIAIDYLNNTNNTLLKREEFHYNKGDFVGKNWLETIAGCSGCGSDPNSFEAINMNKVEFHKNLIKKVTKLYYENDVVDTYKVEYSDYDEFGFYKKIKKSNSFNTLIKYIKNEYHHERGYWYLGLPKTVKLSDDDTTYSTVKEIIYHDFSNTGLYQELKVPYRELEYGIWKKQYSSYLTDGNFNVIEFNEKLRMSDGNRSSKNKYVRFSNYYRGFPRNINFPGRYSDTTSDEVTISRTIDYFGNITKFTDLEGHTYQYAYDDLNRIKAIDVPGNQLDYTIEWDVDASSLLPKRTEKRCVYNFLSDTCGEVKLSTTVEFNSLLQPIKTSVEEVESGKIKYQKNVYNDNGLIDFQSNWSNNSEEVNGKHLTYDKLQRISGYYFDGGISQSKTYIAENKIAVTNGRQKTTTNEYLAYGEPDYSVINKITSPESDITTEISYNIFGNVKSISQMGTHPNQQYMQYAYESRKYTSEQQLCLIERSDVGDTGFVRDNYGKVEHLHRRDLDSKCPTGGNAGNSPMFYYDNYGNKLKDFYWGQPGNIEYSFDGNGNLKEAKIGSISQAYNYNELNQLMDETLVVDGKIFTLEYDYSSLGHLKEITYPDPLLGTVSLNPDVFGQPRSIYNDNSVFATDINFYPSGQLDSFNYGNGINRKIELYEGSQYVKNIIDESVSSSIVDLNYTYDNNANIASIIDNVQIGNSILDLEYDNIDRLISTTGGAIIGSSSLQYDSFGNILSFKVEGGQLNKNLTYGYDINNKLTSVTGQGSSGYDFSRTDSYDIKGNITHNGKRSFSYNLAQQMVSSENNTYVYDSFNRRIKSTEGSKVSYSFYSQQGTLLYRETEQGPVNYIYLNDNLIAKTGTGVNFQQNSRSSVQAFGQSNNNRDDIGYTGHKYDNSLELTYMQARYYDPVIGRFLSNDPVGFLEHLNGTQGIQGFNRYAYVNNNPYKHTDPSGESASAAATGQLGHELDKQINHVKSKMTAEEFKQAEVDATIIVASVLPIGRATVAIGKTASTTLAKISDKVSSMSPKEKLDTVTTVVDGAMELVNAAMGNIDLGRDTNVNGKLDGGSLSGSKTISTVLGEAEQKKFKPKIPFKLKIR